MSSQAIRLPFVVTAIVMVTAIVTRVIGLDDRGLEYDEIWTITNYIALSATQILSEIATPNNHTLHTLLVKGLLLVPRIILSCAFLPLSQVY